MAMACGDPPDGRARWTLKLLADQLVECEIVESISTETVRIVLKKRTQAVAEADLVIPPEESAEFVCAMENVLEVYQRPYDDEVLVCMDETRAPRSAAPGKVAEYDYEYERNVWSVAFQTG